VIRRNAFDVNIAGRYPLADASAANSATSIVRRNHPHRRPGSASAYPSLRFGQDRVERLAAALHLGEYVIAGSIQNARDRHHTVARNPREALRDRNSAQTLASIARLTRVAIADPRSRRRPAHQFFVRRGPPTYRCARRHNLRALVVPD